MQLSGKPSQALTSYSKVRIEVLNGSTHRADLGEKRDAYLTLLSLNVLIS